MVNLKCCYGIYFLRNMSFVFLAGSIGLFFILMHTGTRGVEKYLEYGIAYGIHLIGRFTGLFSVYPQYSMITIYYKLQAITFFVDYECSGIIETLVYICLLAFYPIYSFFKKLVFSMVGIVYIFLANIIRVLLICIIIKTYGPSLFFFSHTVFARLLFFIMMVVLYYSVFTKPHIKKQKVGDLSYGN